VSDESQGPGWWLASDGKWYPPEQAPGYQPPGAAPAASTGTADIGAAVSYGWAKFSQNAGPVLVIVLIPVGIQLVLSLIANLTVDSFAGMAIFNIISFVISLVTAIGIFNAGLLLTAGETPDVGRAYSSDRWGEWILFALVWGLMVGIGAIFCGVGALIVVAIWGLAPFYFIDRRMSLGEALRASTERTGQVPGLRVSLGLLPLVGIVGVFACGIGLFVTMPIAYIGAAYLYRVANNQPVAA
jgi:uncharacterized membrane protein